MSSQNRIIWQEGLFIKPQHFQQQQRHIDYLLHSQLTTLSHYHYGISALEINRELLNLGKFGLLSASGIFNDGTPFSMPSEDFLPDTIDIKDISTRESQDIYLALPTTNPSVNDIQSAYHTSDARTVRYREDVQEVRDVHTPQGNNAQVFVARLAPRLMQGSEDRSAYTCILIARIRHIEQDGRIELDQQFIPTCLSVKASTILRDFLTEIAGTLDQRTGTLSSRIGSPSQQGIADVTEFLMLQLLNRQFPFYTHLQAQPTIHPEFLYRHLISFAGELMTFTDASRIAHIYPEYDHDDLTTTFNDVLRGIRIALSTVLMPRAVSIQLIDREHGIKIASINDRDLLERAEFILAVTAQIPDEQLRRQFVQQTKITSPDNLRHLVSIQLPGVLLTPLSAVPRQLPYHSGYTYFKLDTLGQEWQQIKTHHALAFHVSGHFPALDMQLWAIRG
ncbi:type VI secretion system baseplate subunit TssK [Muribacter muris]|uniref:Type VI secretion system baseplate subunit TssK n=1 Tax=Muribacter muris TaxID=67855 RepID=A0A4Y9JU26_9PAST|nr:type VI secretion system baseplate subunit TssK [Muribacter muris]MBF0785583.1 type VI secretion system baseplate subunit TssK [Muribacter muris]MBF0827999.1 type VI secretion system baseplate subunit TssK [Muribacter muris]TFV09078.1 type VI secretion system baseplate subunit TssK [Muribacter muris]